MHGTITALNGMIGLLYFAKGYQVHIVLIQYCIVHIHVLSMYVKYTFILRYAECTYVCMCELTIRAMHVV